MPYDDSDVKKMIKYQTERKVGFSRSKRISDEVKNLIHCILEAQVERRYTVQQITQHSWMQGASAVASLSPTAGLTASAARAQTPSAAPARVTIIAGETDATAGGRPVATTPAAVANDTLSQNNNSSNSDDENSVWSLLGDIIRDVGSIFAPPVTSPVAPPAAILLKQATDRELQQAACYAFQSAVDRKRLHKKASNIWPKRRSSIFMTLRRPWR